MKLLQSCVLLIPSGDTFAARFSRKMTESTTPSAAFSRTPLLRIVAAFALASFALILAKSMATGMDPDENVFLASAALWKKGLLPYRDFHFNHLPTLVVIYSLLFNL